LLCREGVSMSVGCIDLVLPSYDASALLSHLQCVVEVYYGSFRAVSYIWELTLGYVMF
jgi:hypothetical protein